MSLRQHSRLGLLVVMCVPSVTLTFPTTTQEEFSSEEELLIRLEFLEKIALWTGLNIPYEKLLVLWQGVFLSNSISFHY